MTAAKTMAIEVHKQFFQDGKDPKAKGYAGALLLNLKEYYPEGSEERDRVAAALTGAPAISRLVAMWKDEEGGWEFPHVAAWNHARQQKDQQAEAQKEALVTLDFDPPPPGPEPKFAVECLAWMETFKAAHMEIQSNGEWKFKDESVTYVRALGLYNRALSWYRHFDKIAPTAKPKLHPYLGFLASALRVCEQRG